MYIIFQLVSRIRCGENKYRTSSKTSCTAYVSKIWVDFTQANTRKMFKHGNYNLTGQTNLELNPHNRVCNMNY